MDCPIIEEEKTLPQDEAAAAPDKPMDDEPEKKTDEKEEVYASFESDGALLIRDDNGHVVVLNRFVVSIDLIIKSECMITITMWSKINGTLSQEFHMSSEKNAMLFMKQIAKAMGRTK